MRESRLTLGSLFSGSGGFELGGVINNIEPLWASEVEPYPIKVTRKNFPNMKHYGDVSKIDGGKIPPVDIIAGGSPCFPKGVMIFTDKGTVPIEEVTTDMMVLTHRGRWRKVLATGHKEADTVVLKGNMSGLECTKNHPIYEAEIIKDKAGRRMFTGTRNWTPAENMDNKYWGTPCFAEELSIPVPTSDNPSVKEFPQIDEKLFYFVGRWLGDGWVRDGQRPERTEGQKFATIYLCDSLDKENELIETITPLTEHFSKEYQGASVKVKFNSRLLCDWLGQNFGKGALNKQIPSWAFGMNEKYRKALFNGLMDSDGWRKKSDCYRLTTASKKLTLGVRLLAESLGFLTNTFHTQRDNTHIIEGRVVNQHDTYILSMNTSNTVNRLNDGLQSWYKVREVKETGQIKTVYNLTVEEDNSYIADGIVVHNCQNLSIAGNRKGLEGSESGLFRQQIRIIKEMRKDTNGKYPKYVVWENVKGALSCNNGEDFKEVLESFVSIKEPGVSIPRPKKWGKAGLIVGKGYSFAWRVLDAEYWGVPQRRERIYLVGCLDNERAGEILFVEEGEGRDSQTFSGEGNGSAEGIKRSPDGVVYAFEGNMIDRDKVDMNGIGIKEDRCYTLNTIDRHGVSYSKNNKALLFDNHREDARYTGPLDVAPTMQARYGTGGDNVPYVTEKYLGGLNDQGGESINGFDDKAPTLRAQSHDHEPIIYASTHADLHVNWRTDTANTLTMTDYKDTPATVYVRAHGGTNNQWHSDHTGAIKACDSIEAATCVYPVYTKNHGQFADWSKNNMGTLMASDYKEAGTISYPPDGKKYVVRHLMPVECGRLQGFPDSWTDDTELANPTEEDMVFWRNVWDTKSDIDGKKHKSDAEIRKWLANRQPDAAIYKMWGNGVALPCVDFVMGRIAADGKH